MRKQYAIKLSVNNSDIELTRFPAAFLANVIIAAVSSLKNVAEIKTLELAEDDGSIKIVVNGDRITLNTFPNEYFINTINGLLSTLRGVNDIKTANIELKTLG
ncbi:hypothetical protein ACFLWJ_00215 [Chloroflexota bacterium]